MTTSEFAERLVREAVAKLKLRWGEEALAGDLTSAGHENRQLCAIRASVADEIAIQIQMEINRHG
jgi:hypothetical protein